jgi:eukaryotic-like serine/threonine-protein kinase
MSSQLDPLIGHEIDGYLIEKLLGKGGMARVYRGQEMRLGRYVAIKVIEPQARTNPEYTARFQKEARAVAQLQHPHVVSIYRFGEINGLFYMVMQFIDGTDLGWILKDFAHDNELMQHEDVLRITSHIGSALDHAHSKGVIHRDVKPSNVMLDKEGRAILTDFGLALVQTEGTRGEIFGTPHYIAPEQAVTSAGVVPQSDQYSLGVVLYEMLTGGLPYDGTSPMDVAMAHMSEPLPSPLERNPDLHPAFVSVLERVLQKEPSDRYPTCAALVADLERAIRQQVELPSTLSRVSMLGVSEQVKEFRSAHPLPPPPAVLVAPTPPAPQQPSAAQTRRVSPATVIRRPTNQRQMWTFVAIASIIVALVGIIAVLALIGAN